MKICKVFFAAAVIGTLAGVPVDAQTFTTRQVAVTGTAILRGTTNTGMQLSEFNPILADQAEDSEATRRGVGLGPGPAVATSSAAVAASNPELTLSFDGLRMIDSRLADGGQTFAEEPPDQGLCAGNGFVLESVNDAIHVYDTNGNALAGVTSHNTFYGYPVAISRSGEFGPQIFDPVCYYDPDTQRWFHLVTTSDRVGTTSAFAGTNHLDLAVSQTSSPLGLWNVYRIPAQNDGTQGTPNHHCEGGPCFADYPKMGADANGIYITTNEYPLFGGISRGAQIYAISKRALAAGLAPVTVVQFDTSDPDLTLDGHPGFTVWPATAAGANATDLGGTEYFLSAANLFFPGKSFEPVPSSDNRLRIWSLSNTASLNSNNPALVLHHGVVTVQTYSFAPLAGQKEGNVPLADCLNDSAVPTAFGDGCWRNIFTNKPPGNERESQYVYVPFSMGQVVYAAGKLWGALNTALSLGHGVQAGVAYFVIQPQISSREVEGVVVKQGYLGLAGNHLSYPSIGVTANGKGVIAFSLMGADHFPSAAYATLDAVNGAGDIHIAAEGLGPDDGLTAYKGFIGHPTAARWGDYGATAVDGNSIWIGSEYIGQTCTFAEFVAGAGPNGTCGGTRSVYGNWYTRISKITP